MSNVELLQLIENKLSNHGQKNEYTFSLERGVFENMYFNLDDAEGIVLSEAELEQLLKLARIGQEVSDDKQAKINE